MKSSTYELEFITPAFLAGASQGKSELRAASVRGALRWWFRVLGGTKAEETEVFGGVQGGAKRSKIIVRCCIEKEVQEKFPEFKPLSNLGYLYYFASVSGESKGIRIRPEAYFAPGTTFSIQVVDRGLSSALAEKFETAIQCFLRLGALGLRATRGCGAFVERNSLPKSDFQNWAKSLPPKSGVVRLVTDEVFSNAKKAQEHLGGYLRDLRRENHLSGKKRTALGFSDRKSRLSSALKLRPIRVKEGYLAAVFYSDVACTCPSVEGLL